MPPDPASRAADVRAFRGEILDFVGDPATLGDAAHRHFPDGILVVRDGHVTTVGPAAKTLRSLPAGAAVTDYRGKLILPGFVDTHVHYAQTDMIASYGAQRRGLSVLLGAFATFALCLSALALYASLTYTVVQRRSELAVRMAVGANARSILGLVVTEGLVTAVLGVVVGVIASLALGRVLTSQLYGIGPTDPGTLVTISLLLIAAAIGACLVPGIRAVRTDPALALRE